MTIAEAYAGTNGTWGSEYSLTNSSAGIGTQTTDGIYAPFIDTNALARGDQYRLRAYEKVTSGGTQRLCFQAEVMGWGLGQDDIWTMPPLMMLHGWDYTLTRIAGSDRTITWGVRGVTGAVTEAFSASGTTMTSTEYYLASASTTKTDQVASGVYQCWVDLNALVKADVYELKAYNLARDADSTARVLDRVRLAGVRSIKAYMTPSFTFNVEGWEFSLDKMAGADAAIPFSIRKVS